MMEHLPFDRRGFMKLSLAAGFGVAFPQRTSFAGSIDAATFSPHVLISIDANDVVTLTIHRSEFGQGVRTSLAMILADELDADWSKVRVKQATGDIIYGDQDTVGDESISSSWKPLREVGACARMMLISAASKMLAISIAELETECGFVIVKGKNTKISYGRLATLAAHEAIPKEPVTKEDRDFRLIGRSIPGVDLHAITRGALCYGTDV
jgi:isoquinoline 1-oxidoreductase subunit beta